MAHPEASIKSIYSGKIGLMCDDDSFSIDYVSDYTRDDDSISLAKDKGDDSFRNIIDEDHNMTAKNLKAFLKTLPKDKDEVQTTKNDMWTNVSVISTDSDYQQALTNISPSRTLSSSEINELSTISQQISFSRALSRNSTTSCLSTTATKDGIEGRKFSRHGPSQYSNNLMLNMLQSNYHDYNTPMQKNGSASNVSPQSSQSQKPGFDEPETDSQHFSTKSVANEDDEIANKTRTLSRDDVKTSPLTFNEKINLINTDAITKR